MNVRDPKKILVRAPNWIGDQVLAYPFFHFLREAYPGSKITSVCVEWVADLQFKNLIDEVFVLPKSKTPGWIDRFKAVDEGAKILREKGPWDLAFSLPNSISSAWLLYRSGARERVGYAVEGRGLLLTRALRWNADPAVHRSQAYLDLLPSQVKPQMRARDFWGAPPENEFEPARPGILQKFESEKAWPDAMPITPPGEPYWVLGPGAQAESRRWPLERYADVARKIHQSTGWLGIIVGGKKEEPLAEMLLSDPSLKLKSEVGTRSIVRLHRLLKGAQFTLCNESGLAHVAALCGSPVQIVTGAADPRRTRPLGPGKVQVKVNPVECWPCEKNVCAQPPSQFIKCLRGIFPDEIWEEIRIGLLPS